MSHFEADASSACVARGPFRTFARAKGGAEGVGGKTNIILSGSARVLRQGAIHPAKGKPQLQGKSTYSEALPTPGPAA